jgi:predicted DNA-binding transcriptional regulator AlpA
MSISGFAPRPATGTDPIELLTQREAADVLRISLRQLQRLEDAGDGPPRTRLSERRVAYPKAALAEWVRQRTALPKDAAA